MGTTCMPDACGGQGREHWIHLEMELQRVVWVELTWVLWKQRKCSNY